MQGLGRMSFNPGETLRQTLADSGRTPTTEFARWIRDPLQSDESL